jgi:hypothetical protein
MRQEAIEWDKLHDGREMEYIQFDCLLFHIAIDSLQLATVATYF